MREGVLRVFPKGPGIPKRSASYLKNVEEQYVNDACNSLSIEGYKVSTELIEKVRSGKWNPDVDMGDRDQRDALAARGYWQAFQVVKASINFVLGGANAGQITVGDLQGRWAGHHERAWSATPYFGLTRLMVPRMSAIRLPLPVQ